MSNIFKKNISLLIVISFLASPTSNFCDNKIKGDSNENVSMGLFAFGAGIVGGLGLAQLFSSKSDSQIIEGSIDSLDISHGYDEQVQILEEALDLSKLLKNSKGKLIVSTLDEEINYELASNGISIDDHYIKNLYKLIEDLKFYQNKLPKRINKLNYKLKRTKDYDNNLQMVNQMQELLKSIDQVLPKLEFLKNYINARLDYFKTYNTIILISEIYNKEISNLEKYTEDKLAKELTRSARAKYSESSLYPCIDYVKSVENDIYNIEKHVKKLPKAYQDLNEDAQDLVEYLLKIKQGVVGDPEYLQEKRDLNAENNPKPFLGLAYTVC